MRAGGPRWTPGGCTPRRNARRPMLRSLQMLSRSALIGMGAVIALATTACQAPIQQRVEVMANEPTVMAPSTFAGVTFETFLLSLPAAIT